MTSSTSSTSSSSDEVPMTDLEKLAAEERDEYEAATAEERKLFHNLIDFIHDRHPNRSTHAIAVRSKLHLAGDRANPFWRRIDEGMTLATVSNLFRDATTTWRAGRDKNKTWDDIVREIFSRYDAQGTLRSFNGKTYRASTPKARAERVARGEAPTGTGSGKGDSRHRAVVRDAIAAWIHVRMPKGDPRAKAWAGEFMREVEIVLESFTQRFQTAKPRRDELFSACALLNIPRPRWGQPADQKRAWKNRRSALASTHPDKLGTAVFGEGERDAFQAIADAYNVIVAYNDSLNPSADSPDEKEPFEKTDESTKKQAKKESD